ncbi:MAG: 1,4-dihydroxy-2-naphthoate octaprenyltransferase, partial [Calditrichaeota bacterium]|nr:1,4-dihydroxy-2-naphthoate octaprenyltransferase [Calditrichota bacterium]
HFLYFMAALLGGLFIHAGSNLFNDFYDYKTGADTQPTSGSGLLVQKILRPEQVFHAALLMFLLAFLLGIYLVAVRGWVIVALGIGGLLGGYFYTARPINLKYRALGEPVIFLLFGVLMVWGAWFVQTGRFAWEPMLVSVPVALLVTAIVHANNLRDILTDQKAGFRTLSAHLNPRGSSLFYCALVALSFLWLLPMVLSGILEWYVFVALLSLPAALKVVKVVRRLDAKPDSPLAFADVLTAQLHMQYGLLLAAGILVGKWL